MLIVNQILERFQRTQLIDHVNQNEPQFGDFTGYDFQTNSNTIARVQTMFNELPANVREQFDHDPAVYLEFVSNPDNIKDMKDGQIDNIITDGIPEEASASEEIPSEPEA